MVVAIQSDDCDGQIDISDFSRSFVLFSFTFGYRFFCNSVISMMFPYTANMSLSEQVILLSQSARGLGCGCTKLGFGRGHVCASKLPESYFNF